MKPCGEYTQERALVQYFNRTEMEPQQQLATGYSHLLLPEQLPAQGFAVSAIWDLFFP